MSTSSCYATGKTATSYTLSSVKQRNKHQSPENHENPFALSFKANFKIIHALQSSLLRYQGWIFSKTTNTLRSNFWKKIKLKIYPLAIIKTLLLYHLKQTSWQSFHKWRSFRTWKFNIMVPGLIFLRPQIH